MFSRLLFRAEPTWPCRLRSQRPAVTLWPLQGQVGLRTHQEASGRMGGPGAGTRQGGLREEGQRAALLHTLTSRKPLGS